jgi:hypothetical protein
MPDLCRFCLSEDNERSNPLLSPCLCAGTMKFVHRNCLIQWRTVTTFNMFKTNCQLCHAPYAIPRRWLEERMPYVDKFWDYVLSQTFFIIVLVYYLHILIGSRLFEKEINIYLISKISITVFNYLLFNTSFIYALYYFFLIKKVINKQLYFYYNAYNILQYISGCAVCLYFIQFAIFPFGGIYLYLLSYFYTLHVKTLEKINVLGAF